MLDLFALFLVGLSLFFHGVGGIKTNLQGLTSRRLRRQLARWAGHPVLAGAWGFLFGAITQSSTAVAFILTGLVSGGLMSVARALPIVAWANLGTVVLVFSAAFNVHLAFLYLLGVSGLALAFDLGSPRARPVLAAVFSAGLLFFGLQLMKESFAPLPRYPWFKDVAEFLQGSALATFIAGALLRVIVQSSSGIAVIAIALAHGGILTNDQAAMMMYGTGAGVGISVFLLSTNLHGIGRQIALYQAVINGFSGLTLGALDHLEKATGWTLALGLSHRLASSESLRLAFSFLFLQSVAVAAALVFSRFAARWLERISPPTEEQDLSRPRFITDHALADPESALDLAEKEQARLLGLLPGQLDTIRPETASSAPLSAAVIHRAAESVGGEVRGFLRELADQHGDRATSRRLLLLERRQTLIGSLDETVHGFVGTFEQICVGGTQAGPFLGNLAESLNTLVLTACDAAGSGDPSDAEMLVRLTADRSDMMERVRANLSGDGQSIDHRQKALLFYLSSLFERAVWLLRQLGHSLQSLDPAARPDSQS